MKNQILNTLKNGNMTVEEVATITEISVPAVDIILKNLSEAGIVTELDGKYSLPTEVTPVAEVAPETEVVIPAIQTTQTPTKQVKDMKNKKTLNLTPEQQAFRNLVQKKRGAIYDEQEKGKIFVHRGNQVLFAGCGDQALRYKIAVVGMSDKESVEYAVMYLDWDDSALYDKDGLADQIKAIVGNPVPQIKPTIVANQAGVQGAK